MYRILFIDEQEEDIEDFQEYVENFDSEKKLEVITTFPEPSLDDMIEMILDLHIDAVVTDYKLNDYKTSIKYNVPYDGADLVYRILQEREGFPCFVLTAYDDEAVGKSEDVNQIYIKGILHGTEERTSAKAKFIDRLRNQIEHYRKKIKDKENRILELTRKAEESFLDAYEEEELIELDAFIERALDKKSAIPKRPKEDGDKLSILLRKVEELKNKLE